MLVIHGIWADGALRVWAEDSGCAAAVAARPDGALSFARPHPFAAAPAALADVLAGLDDVADIVRKATEDELTLWLPSTRDRPAGSPDAAEVAEATGPVAATGSRRLTTGTSPVASPPRIAPAAAARTMLAPWQLPGLGFEPGAALALLRAVGQPDARLADGILAGSLHYLAALAALAADLAVRGRVLPGVHTADDGSYAARWRPVLAGPDALRARELTGALPPLCRATNAAGESSAAIVTEALDLLTDAAVRARLARQPGFALLPPGGVAHEGPPLTDRWAAALTGADGRLAVSERDRARAAQLAFALWAWQDAAQEPPGPVRTCFRLIEPDAAGDDDSWQVELALQATDDPSLLLPAADIWSGEATDGWSAAGVSYPEDDLLAGLGKASRLFPELDEALQNAAPEAVPLDARGALRFLTETGPLLAGAGFGVLLPDWVRRSRLGLKLTARSRNTGQGSVTGPVFGLADLVNFRYELAIGDQTLSADELTELARLKVPLIRLRGQWVELDERHLKAALRFLERRGSGTMAAGDALAVGLGQDVAELPVTEVDADGWLGDLLSGAADRRVAPMSTPASFHGQLRPYQERGLAWLSFLGGLGLGAVLADDMGLGKSPQTLALLQAERDAGTAAGPTLLVCPMSLVGNWQREAAKFTPGLSVHVHHGADRLSGPELAATVAAADLVITSYGVASRDRAALGVVPWSRVVCDEAQNIKNARTRQAEAVRSIPARSRIALTGTPVENRLTELWSIMEFTSPGLLGPAERFRQRFAIPIERNGDVAATEQLRRLTGPFILRRVKTDKSVIADLPDKLEMKVWCNLTPEQASLYQATVDDMMARIEAAEPGIERRGLVLATMAKLKQVCNHPAHLLGDGSRLDGRSGKLARLEEICEEITEAGDRALCFTQYAEFGRMLQPYLASPAWLPGSLPARRHPEEAAG